MAELRKHAGAEAKSAEKQTEYTTNPVHLIIVSSARGPMGMHFKDGLVNEETKAAMKQIRSPTDNYTYVFNWHGKSHLWAHLKTIEHKGFCTLGDLLNTDEFVHALWNDASLVKSMTFHKDRYDGPEITETAAIELNKQYQPSLASASEPSTSTDQKRRVF